MGNRISGPTTVAVLWICLNLKSAPPYLIGSADRFRSNPDSPLLRLMKSLITSSKGGFDSRAQIWNLIDRW